LRQTDIYVWEHKQEQAFEDEGAESSEVDLSNINVVEATNFKEVKY
jgi:hypothetical protein